MKEITPLLTRMPLDGKEIILTHDYIVEIDGHEYTMPADSHSDGASIPNRFGFRRFVGSPLTGPYRNQAVIHDGFYRRNMYIDGIHISKVLISQKDVDEIFNKSMMGHVCWLRRQALYRGVRIGGWVAWRKGSV